MEGTDDWLDEHEDRAWESFLETQVRFWRKLAHLLQQDTGLSEPDFAILNALMASPGGQLRPFELSGVTQFEKSRLHHQLTRMVGRGLITRERCPDASRGAMITLTEYGRAAITAAVPRRAAHIREWLISPLDPGQLTALTGISEAILDKLRADDTAAPESARDEGEGRDDEAGPEGGAGPGEASQDEAGPHGSPAAAAEGDPAQGTAEDTEDDDATASCTES